MKNNKGSVLVIVLTMALLVAVGGVIYYAGKSSKTIPFVEENNLLQENQGNVVNNPVNNNTTTVTTTTTTVATPSITVLSPNGGESYTTSTTIKQIPVTWKSSGIVSRNVAIYVKNVSTGNEAPILVAPDNGSTEIYGIPSGNYKIRICNTNAQSGNFEVVYNPDCSSASDYSDNSFTVQ